MEILSVSHDPRTIARIFDENQTLKRRNAILVEALEEIVDLVPLYTTGHPAYSTTYQVGLRQKVARARSAIAAAPTP